MVFSPTPAIFSGTIGITIESPCWPRSDHGHVEDELDIIPLLRTVVATNVGIG